MKHILHKKQRIYFRIVHAIPNFFVKPSVLERAILTALFTFGTPYTKCQKRGKLRIVYEGHKLNTACLFK